MWTGDLIIVSTKGEEKWQFLFSVEIYWGKVGNGNKLLFPEARSSYLPPISWGKEHKGYCTDLIYFLSK
jgi:hypothetical protein